MKPEYVIPLLCVLVACFYVGRGMADMVFDEKDEECVRWVKTFAECRARFHDEFIRSACHKLRMWLEGAIANASKAEYRQILTANQLQYFLEVISCKKVDCICDHWDMCQEARAKLKSQYSFNFTQLHDQMKSGDVKKDDHGPHSMMAMANHPRRSKRQIDFAAEAETVRKFGKVTRKEIRAMSEEERNRFFSALNTLKTDKVDNMSKYDIMIVYHTSERAPEAHSSAAFMPFHREFVKNMEVALRLIDPEVAMPYWDSSLDDPLPEPADSVLWSDELYGNGDGEVVIGPFANWTTLTDSIVADLTPSKKIVRAVGQDQRAREAMIGEKDIQKILAKPQFRNLVFCVDPFTELVHGANHLFVGGHMVDLRTSPNDPSFFLLHAFVDLIWELWRQSKSPSVRSTYVSDNETCNPYAQADMLIKPFTTKLIDGLSNTYLDEFYSYQDRPKCTPQSPSCDDSPHLYCDAPNSRCLSKIRLNGNCTGYDGKDICYKSKCEKGKCVLVTQTTPSPTTTPLPTSMVSSAPTSSPLVSSTPQIIATDPRTPMANPFVVPSTSSKPTSTIPSTTTTPEPSTSPSTTTPLATSTPITTTIPPTTVITTQATTTQTVPPTTVTTTPGPTTVPTTEITTPSTPLAAITSTQGTTTISATKETMLTRTELDTTPPSTSATATLPTTTQNVMTMTVSSAGNSQGPISSSGSEASTASSTPFGVSMSGSPGPQGTTTTPNGLIIYNHGTTGALIESPAATSALPDLEISTPTPGGNDIYPVHPPSQTTTVKDAPSTVWFPITVLSWQGGNTTGIYPNASIISHCSDGKTYPGKHADPNAKPYYTGAAYGSMPCPFSGPNPSKANIIVQDESGKPCMSLCLDKDNKYSPCNATLTLDIDKSKSDSIPRTPNLARAKFLSWNGNERALDKFLFLCTAQNTGETGSTTTSPTNAPNTSSKYSIALDNGNFANIVTTNDEKHQIFNGGCLNMHRCCGLWATGGECPRNIWMQLACQASCNVCDSGYDQKQPVTSCMDFHPRCPEWGAIGQCTDYAPWMEENCRKTCNVCSRNPQDLAVLCGSPKKSGCQNYQADCDGWAKRGECESNLWWMRENCPLSCKICSAPTS